ncbi:MAG: thioredoxin family protein [Elusimicrobiota bacterium]|jgi:hypothetical protein
MRAFTVLFLLVFGTRPAGAASSDYSAAALSLQQQKGGYAVVQFDSSDCSLCPRQAAALDRLSADPYWKSVLFLRARYEQEAALRNAYGVSSMATVLVLRAGRVIGRSVGMYLEEDLRGFLIRSRMQDRGRPRSRPARRFGPHR